MKQLLTTVLLGAALSAGAQAPMKFTIQGDVSKVQPAIAMVKLSYSVDGEQVKDSAVVVNGKYRFKGELTEPRMGFFSLKYVNDSLNKKLSSRRDAFSAYLDKGEIAITSTDSFSNRSVAGSKAHDVYESLRKLEKSWDQRFDDIYKQISASKDDKESQKALQQTARELDKEMKEKIYADFIRKNPGSPMAIYALNTYAGYMMNPDDVEPLFEMLPEKTRNSYSGKDFAEKLEGAKRLRIGMEATGFTQNDTSGVPVSFAAFKGKYVLVDFWASWCGPCRRENPNVVAAFNKYKDKNFTVLGVALEREGDKDKWMKAIYKDGLTWTHVSDFKYFNNEVARLYGINAIPRNFLVGPDGKILATDLRGEDLQQKLDEILQ